MILVADRSEITRRVVREILVKQGFHVMGVESTADALRVIARLGPRLEGVVAESTPGGGSGFDLAGEIGAAAPHIPLLAMSNTTLHLIGQGQEEALAESANVIQKPFTQSLLLDRLESMLAKKPGPQVLYKTASTAN